MPLGGLTHMGTRHYVLEDSQHKTNPFAAAKGDKSAMQTFIKIR